MAEAMIGGLLSQDLVEPQRLIASDRYSARLDVVQERFSIKTTIDNRVAVKKAHVIVLAVKPQALDAVFRELRDQIGGNALVVSIVAGVTIASIAKGLGHRGIVRTMPNTPSQVGEGMTVWAATEAVTDAQRDQARAIVTALGQELYVEDEKFLDMAAAISGSGPAYVFLLMEALMDAAVHLGFSRVDARQLVVQTIRGSAVFAGKSSAHPAEMRNLVTSPGGTTAAALFQLEKGAFRTVLSKAVAAAHQRSLSLGLSMGAATEQPSKLSKSSKSSRPAARQTKAATRKRRKAHD